MRSCVSCLRLGSACWAGRPGCGMPTAYPKYDDHHITGALDALAWRKPNEEGAHPFECAPEALASLPIHQSLRRLDTPRKASRPEPNSHTAPGSGTAAMLVEMFISPASVLI